MYFQFLKDLSFLNNYIIYIVLGLSCFSFILFILSIIALVKAGNLKRRLNKILQPSQNQNLEAMLLDYLEQVKKVNADQNSILESIEIINSKLLNCIQKIGVVRYNPFEDVGGELCFAVAMLDEKNDGFILNSIYSREGCYTYAKPILNGESSKYKLSREEEDALKLALKKKS